MVSALTSHLPDLTPGSLLPQVGPVSLPVLPTQSDKNTAAIRRSLPRLGGMITAIATGIKWGSKSLVRPMMVGTALGGAVELVLLLLEKQGKNSVYRDHSLADLVKLAFWEDAFSATMSISIARLIGLKWGISHPLIRGFMVSESIEVAHAVKRLSLPEVDDLVIAGISGLVGGAWAPYLQNKWKTELVAEVGREFSENMAQMAMDGHRVTQEVALETLVMSLAELGGALGGQRGGVRVSEQEQVKLSHDREQVDGQEQVKLSRGRGVVDDVVGLGQRIDQLSKIFLSDTHDVSGQRGRSVTGKFPINLTSTSGVLFSHDDNAFDFPRYLSESFTTPHGAGVAFTHVGIDKRVFQQKRPAHEASNDDSVAVWVHNDVTYLMACDGFGEDKGLWSRRAVEIVQVYIKEHGVLGMADAFKLANETIQKEKIAEGLPESYADSGTTATLVAVSKNGRVRVAMAGDTNFMVRRPQGDGSFALIQPFYPQNLAGLLHAQGELGSKLELYDDGRSNQLLSNLGMAPLEQVSEQSLGDFERRELLVTTLKDPGHPKQDFILQPRDEVFLASDGLVSLLMDGSLKTMALEKMEAEAKRRLDLFQNYYPILRTGRARLPNGTAPRYVDVQGNVYNSWTSTDVITNLSPADSGFLRVSFMLEQVALYKRIQIAEPGDLNGLWIDVDGRVWKDEKGQDLKTDLASLIKPDNITGLGLRFSPPMWVNPRTKAGSNGSKPSSDPTLASLSAYLGEALAGPQRLDQSWIPPAPRHDDVPDRKRYQRPVVHAPGRDGWKHPEWDKIHVNPAVEPVSEAPRGAVVIDLFPTDNSPEAEFRRRVDKVFAGYGRHDSKAKATVTEHQTPDGQYSLFTVASQGPYSKKALAHLLGLEDQTPGLLLRDSSYPKDAPEVQYASIRAKGNVALLTTGMTNKTIAELSGVAPLDALVAEYATDANYRMSSNPDGRMRLEKRYGLLGALGRYEKAIVVEIREVGRPFLRKAHAIMAQMRKTAQDLAFYQWQNRVIDSDAWVVVRQQNAAVMNPDYQPELSLQPDQVASVVGQAQRDHEGKATSTSGELVSTLLGFPDAKFYAELRSLQAELARHPDNQVARKRLKKLFESQIARCQRQEDRPWLLNWTRRMLASGFDEAQPQFEVALELEMIRLANKEDFRFALNSAEELAQYQGVEQLPTLYRRVLHGDFLELLRALKFNELKTRLYFMRETGLEEASDLSSLVSQLETLHQYGMLQPQLVASSVKEAAKILEPYQGGHPSQSEPSLDAYRHQTQPQHRSVADHRRELYPRFADLVLDNGDYSAGYRYPQAIDYTHKMARHGLLEAAKLRELTKQAAQAYHDGDYALESRIHDRMIVIMQKANPEFTRPTPTDPPPDLPPVA